jgi:hypothetical protein
VQKHSLKKENQFLRVYEIEESMHNFCGIKQYAEEIYFVESLLEIIEEKLRSINYVMEIYIRHERIIG